MPTERRAAIRARPRRSTPGELAGVIGDLADLKALGSLLEDMGLHISDTAQAHKLAYLAGRVTAHAEHGLAEIENLTPS